VLDVSGLEVLLEREEEDEEELVVLVETAARVAEHLVREVLDHVVQPLHGERRLLRPACTDTPTNGVEVSTTTI